MSNKVSNSFYVHLGVTAMLSCTLALTALQWVQAQSTASAQAGGNAKATGSAAASTSTPAAGSTSAGTSTTAPANPTPDIPAGVLWTDPKYAVKEVQVPARVAVPSASHGTTGTKTGTTAAPKGPDVNPYGYDEKEAKEFAAAASMPQFLWTKQDTARGQKSVALNDKKEMSDYHKTFVEKFVSKMEVPSTATLVESASAKYLYLYSFAIDKSGKIININSENSYGPFTAVHLADDNENAALSSAVAKALAKCSPVKVPPVGNAPWYMLLKYEPDTGKVFVSHLNSM
jgi:hypothetical protein